MKEFNFKKLDAFASANSAGNPAGYVRVDSFDDISDGEMQQIALELKGFVNEVGYLAPAPGGEFCLKYYSAECEVDFCGHATIAIMYDLFKNDSGLQGLDTLSIRTNRGVLTVENRIDEQDAVFILAPEPYDKAILPDMDVLAENLGVSKGDIDTTMPVSIINAGLSTLIVPLKDMQAVLNISPGLEKLKHFCIESGVDIIEVFTGDVINKSNDYRVRVFAPTFGYIEDPATGSGNSAFGYYLIKNGLWEKDFIIIEQNSLRDGYNIVKLRKQCGMDGKNRVLFGGGAIARINGKYLLHNN